MTICPPLYRKLTRQITPTAPGLSDLPPSPSTTGNPMLKHLPQPSPLSYTSQPLQQSLSSHLHLPPYPHAPSGAGSLTPSAIPMAPSISAHSTFSSANGAPGTTTAHQSPVPSASGGGGLSIGIRPLDMVISDEEVHEELERRLDEMRGWLETVGVGLDDLLAVPELREGVQGVTA